ncbi:hypothetical protein LIER_15065 [Lithospermum erythrorhizon]|uniref:Uncharacterized protein n=1 Tax=Lithospermum erythrorhizon TaxID=34254 RepID=A0AAV3Q618_LITER
MWKIVSKGSLDKKLHQSHLQTMAQEMKLKYDKYWSQCDILLSIGAFLYPRPALYYYIEEKVFKVPPDVKFDVLQWWMVNEPKYPILRKRIIDPKKASMKVSTVKMLLCGSEWVKELYGIKRARRKEQMLYVY